MTQELTQVATLAEAFTEERPKSAKGSWSHLADSLDQEGSLVYDSLLRSSYFTPTGVNLWNISGLVRKGPEEGGHNALVAARAFLLFRICARTERNVPRSQSDLRPFVS